MHTEVSALIQTMESELIQFAQELIKIPSITGEEGDIANCIKAKMLSLGYDNVVVDEIGNVIGIIGHGPVKILFDAHMDTVSVNNPRKWAYNPFGGEIVDGKLYGRGSVDVKSAIAATVYAGHAIKRLGLHQGKTIIISTSVMEEDIDAVALYKICQRGDVQPDYVVICEPSSLNLALGHKGRAMIKVTTGGVSAHGSTPDKGINAIYKMCPVIQRVNALNHELEKQGDIAGTVALTKIDCDTVSLNAIPDKCEIYLDRRLTVRENEAYISKEMEKLVEGTDATWEIYDVSARSYTGEPIFLHSFLPFWEIDKTHVLTQACIDAYKVLNNRSPQMITWDFSTNGFATAGMLGIPTIGFGPGDPKKAHMEDEYCPVSEIISAMEFYTLLPVFIPSPENARIS
jgi:putative selenium metabolism hydrolase